MGEVGDGSLHKNSGVEAKADRDDGGEVDDDGADSLRGQRNRREQALTLLTSGKRSAKLFWTTDAIDSMAASIAAGDDLLRQDWSIWRS
jgi:hypothetical protein